MPGFTEAHGTGLLRVRRPIFGWFVRLPSLFFIVPGFAETHDCRPLIASFDDKYLLVFVLNHNSLPSWVLLPILRVLPTSICPLSTIMKSPLFLEPSAIGLFVLRNYI